MHFQLLPFLILRSYALAHTSIKILFSYHPVTDQYLYQQYPYTYQNSIHIKGMEFIDLHSIFKDNLVISSIPNYLNNSNTPIICYKYSKPIRSTIFNFNKIVTDKDIDSNTPDP